MEEKRKNYTPLDGGKMYAFWLLASLILSFSISIILMILAKVNGDDTSVLTQNIGFQFCYSVILYVVVFTIFILFHRKNNIDLMSATRLNRKPNIKTLIVCFALGLVFVLLTSPIINCWVWALQTLNVKAPSDFVLNSVWEYIGALFIVALLPAVMEELLFRGVILNSLRKLGKWSAILISATAFALMHGNLFQLPYTFGFGILLGYIAFETGSLLPTMLIHFISNAQVLTFAFFKIGGEAEVVVNWSYFGIAMAFLAATAAIVALAVFLIKKFNKNTPSETEVIKEMEQEQTEINGIVVPREKQEAEKKAATKIWVIAFTAAMLIIVLNFF